MLKQAKYYLPEAYLIPSIRVFWSPTSGTAAQCGEPVVLLKKSAFKNLKTAARIVTNSKFDASTRPLTERLVWITIDELIAQESKTVV